MGVPILFLIQSDNPTARYFLQVALIFIVSMSMLLIIFVPAFINYYTKGARANGPRVTVTGIDLGNDSEQLQSMRQSYNARNSLSGHFDRTGRTSGSGSENSNLRSSFGGTGLGGTGVAPSRLPPLESIDEKNDAQFLASAARAKKREIEETVCKPSLMSSIELAMKEVEESGNLSSSDKEGDDTEQTKNADDTSSG